MARAVGLWAQRTLRSAFGRWRKGEPNRQQLARRATAADVVDVALCCVALCVALESRAKVSTQQLARRALRRWQTTLRHRQAEREAQAYEHGLLRRPIHELVVNGPG